MEIERGIKNREAVVFDLRQRLDRLNKADNMLALHERIAEFGDRIRDAFPDNFDEFELWHVLASSGIEQGREPMHFDFPGEF